MLCTAQIEQFRMQGFLVVEDVLTSDEIAATATRADFIAAGRAENIPEVSIQLEKVFRDADRAVIDPVLAVRKLFNIAVYDDVMWDHVCHPRVVAIVRQLLDTRDLKMYGDQLFMKAPETGTEQPWHQDSTSWRDIFPMDLVTAWTALDDASTDNGCLEFAPGTQRWGMLLRPQLEPFLDDLGSDEWPTVPAPLHAGSISFHHSLILHRSAANTSGLRRRGYAVHYMRASSWRDETVTDAPRMPPFKSVCGRSFSGKV
ncbi:MAG: phytanoyl-CoA dioxygenase family protein [Candidatus Latescibacterota bacterium]|nr:phytanoyl-CoA dioxygenase family protein [Candidatus Latescibacterota bacterium]